MMNDERERHVPKDQQLDLHLVAKIRPGGGDLYSATWNAVRLAFNEGRVVHLIKPGSPRATEERTIIIDPWELRNGLINSGTIETFDDP